MLMIATKGFTRLETALGLFVIAGVLMVVLPKVWWGTGQERQRRAVHRAEYLAAAVLDYRAETGSWPVAAGGGLDVSCLTRTPDRRPEAVSQAMMAGALTGGMPGATGGGPRPWLDEIPVDPWGRPYRVTRATVDDAPGVAVVSAGPDGIYQTDPGRAERGLTGDDLGVVLLVPLDGGPLP